MNQADRSAGSLAIVLKGWPRLSETFIAQELVELERHGLRFDVWSMRHPTDKKRHALHDALQATVRYLPEYLYEEPRRVLKGAAHAIRLPGFGAALKLWLGHLLRDPTPNRVRRFGQAMVLAREASEDLRFIYAHFLHTPSSVALYASMMRGVPWGFSAHAKDIWKSPDWEKRDKLARSTFGATCTALGADHLRGLSSHPGGPRPDLSRPRPVALSGAAACPAEARRIERASSACFGRPAGGEKGLRSAPVGACPAAARAAMAVCPHWRRRPLRGIAGAGGKPWPRGRVEWRGASNQAEVIEALRSSDIFVLPSRIASDGDRDGLPNVLMEAASQELPILSTKVSSIPEFIENGKQGVLVEPDASAIADALVVMMRDPSSRAAYAKAARQRLVSSFGVDAGIDRLAARLNAALA